MDDILLISEVFRFPHRRYHWQMKFLKPRIYWFNWQKKKVLKKIAVPPAYFDREEYEFLRLCYHYSGARGITSNRNYIFIALQNTILVYDRKLEKEIGRIDHPWFNGLHELCWHDERLYVTCAVTDSIVVVSEDGRELATHYLGDNNYFLENFGLQPRVLDNRLDYRLMHRVKRLYHINCVGVAGNEVYANFNLQGSFVKIFPGQEIIIRDKEMRWSHNGQFSPDGKYILINDTRNYSLRVFDPRGNLIRTIDLKTFSLPIRFSEQKTFGRNHEIKAGWLRGLAFSKENRDVVFVGMSPAMIVAVNYLTGEFVDYFQLRANMWISVHGLHNIS